MNWSSSAVTRSCASCRAWAPSSKKKSCAASRSIKQRSGRFLLSFADKTARELTDYLKGSTASKPSPPPAVCGAARRPSAISIFSSPVPMPPRLSIAWRRIRALHEVLGRGLNKTSVKLGREGLQVDVRALEA